MKQIAFALALAPILALAAPAAWAVEKLPLNAISNYLNGLKTVEASFSQINDDGSLSTGKVWIDRPGKMRFEYNPPDSALVLVRAGTVFVDDKKSNQPPEQYPLRKTPLSLILARNVDLSRANMVVGHGFDGTATVVTAQDPKNPEYGKIELMFTADPVELRKWVVHDSSGAKTTVVLGELEKGKKHNTRFFSVTSDNNR
ncbi:outer membrane lipoprotein carrier protein LolA [Ruegeria sp. 2205SS24-7]|uniref:LolA family protein n=1 Tax=Ruegeria discodermiae TaxID=3064389 RepID=UPI00274060B7|nr:outer membrane lipoprotein carrier protein LolA [Ruegeria sp. 2205SS24-7]MDP5218244.1 outer membrane lipoprotein carrier protein LolA [Ruegeria sp. 2205SS24-7]